jgi:hypothetical protein
MRAMITATEARAQGSSPAAILSVAKFNQRIADRTGSAEHAKAAKQLRKVAIELGDLLGINIRRRRLFAAANDNHCNGKTQLRRRRAA